MKMEERLPEFKIICRAKDSFNAQRYSAVYKQWIRVCLSRERDSGENVTPGHAQQFHREYAEYQ